MTKKKEDTQTFLNEGNDTEVIVDTSRESAPVFDPVDVDAYPEVTSAEAQKGNRVIEPHNPESRHSEANLANVTGSYADETLVEHRRTDGTIANVHDYIETEEMRPPGYIAPIYDSAE